MKRAAINGKHYKRGLKELFGKMKRRIDGDRVKELFLFRLERLSRSVDGPKLLRASILESLAADAPISKFSKVIEQAAKQNDLDFLERIVRAKKKGHRRLSRIHAIDLVILWNYDELT